jgi:hypothetical protein
MKTRDWILIAAGIALFCNLLLMLDKCGLKVELHLQVQTGPSIAGANTLPLMAPELPNPLDAEPGSTMPPNGQIVRGYLPAAPFSTRPYRPTPCRSHAHEHPKTP